MLKINEKVNWAISIIKSGYSKKDRLFLGLHFMAWPLRKTFFKNMKLLTNVKIKNLDGIFYCGENFSAVRCAHPSYESEIRKHFSLDSGVFIDVGANIGKYSIMVGKRLGDKVKVIAFEPMPYTFEILKKNIELNKLKNIIPFEYALGKKEERLDFYLDREGVGGGAHSLIKDNANITKNKIGVCVKKLDDILKELKIKRVDLIKIDVEGAEADVLKGTEKTLKKYHPKIIFEAWNKEYLEKCKKILDKFGYKIKQIAPENYIAI